MSLLYYTTIPNLVKEYNNYSCESYDQDDNDNYNNIKHKKLFWTLVCIFYIFITVCYVGSIYLLCKYWKYLSDLVKILSILFLFINPFISLVILFIITFSIKIDKK
jgi:uncharacterized BrkB/YihY/UPF0761 family membrane protein